MRAVCRACGKTYKVPRPGEYTCKACGGKVTPDPEARPDVGTEEPPGADSKQAEKELWRAHRTLQGLRNLTVPR